MSVPHTILKRLGDAAMNALIDAIERTLNRLEAHPFANMKILQPILFTALVNQRVVHGLGYPATGFLIIDASSQTSVARSSTPDTDPNNAFTLGASVTSLVTLAVF